MMRAIEYAEYIGAVGPSSNVVMGCQNIWNQYVCDRMITSFLVGFCVLLKREALDKAGGIQHMNVGGDDLDLSIRIRKAGYNLLALKSVFVYHHGFQTGERIHGKPNIPGGWNSSEMTENTNIELIRKHGLAEWNDTIQNKILFNFLEYNSSNRKHTTEDEESIIIMQYVNGGIVVELGCGGKKTVPQAIGVDLVDKGEEVPFELFESVADVNADVTKPLPFPNGSVHTIIARHIFEHCMDSVETLKNWANALSDDGHLIIACPDERLGDTIAMNPNHVHAYTPDTIKSLALIAGLKEKARHEHFNGVSFVTCLEKS
jgi:SAM-dependent methyltransferase